MHNRLPAFAAAHFVLLLMLLRFGSDKPDNSHNDAPVRVTRKGSATINQKTRSEQNTIKTDQNKTSSYEKIWFRVTRDLVSWHACQSHNLMWVGLKRIGHIANTTHLIAIGEACTMILVD